MINVMIKLTDFIHIQIYIYEHSLLTPVMKY